MTSPDDMRDMSQSLSITRDFLVEQYVQLNKSQVQIANEIGCNRLTILRKLKSYGIEAKQRDGKYHEPFSVNDDYFKRWSPEMAYLLGYIAADGCIRPPRYELKLKSIDDELLEWCNKQLQSSYEIRAEKNTNCSLLYIYSKTIISDLQSLGITPRKSLTIELPQIPEEFFWDYMRGNVDGDGYIGLVKNSQIRFGLTSNRKYLSQVLQKLHEKVGCPFYTINPQGKAGQISIYGVHAYRCLVEMYDNNKYALSRKKERALKAINAWKT